MQILFFVFAQGFHLALGSEDQWDTGKSNQGWLHARQAPDLLYYLSDPCSVVDFALKKVLSRAVMDLVMWNRKSSLGLKEARREGECPGVKCPAAN